MESTRGRTRQERAVTKKRVKSGHGRDKKKQSVWGKTWKIWDRYFRKLSSYQEIETPEEAITEPLRHSMNPLEQHLREMV